MENIRQRLGTGGLSDLLLSQRDVDRYCVRVALSWTLSSMSLKMSVTAANAFEDL